MHKIRKKKKPTNAKEIAKPKFIKTETFAVQNTPVRTVVRQAMDGEKIHPNPCLIKILSTEPL